MSIDQSDVVLQGSEDGVQPTDELIMSRLQLRLDTKLMQRDAFNLCKSSASVDIKNRTYDDAAAQKLYNLNDPFQASQYEAYKNFYQNIDCGK